MQGQVGKEFFENIRRTVKVSFFIASIIPLSLLVYFSIKYVFPYLTAGNAGELPLDIGIVLILAVAISVLGLILTSRATNLSISSLRDFHLRLNSLVEITKQFRDTLYIDILLESIVKSAVHLNSAETGSLLLFDDEGNLRFKVVLGQAQDKLRDRIIKPGEGVSGWVAEHGKSLLINDITKDSRFQPGRDKESGFHTRSIMCVPLIYEKKVIGAIEVLNKKTGDFSQEDEKLLYSLADQAAISIAQSRASEMRQSDIIHITEILVSAQDSQLREQGGHPRRVAKYANLIGRTMGVADSELRHLHYASLLHDIGFLKIDVTEQWEKEKYMQHPQLGYDMMKPVSLWGGAAEFVLNHHERYDGTGYPSAKKGEEIPLGARILCLAETVDVLTSKHSYKKQLDQNEVINEITANSGSQFDPSVVKAFKELAASGELFVEK